MYLTKDEEKILDGEAGWGKKKAMEILMAIGEIYKADKLIKIDNAHVSGASYKNLGDAGLEFLKDLSIDAKVVVDTTLNPIGLDRIQWQWMNIDPKFVEKQMEVLSAYKKMGISDVCTCTPYYLKDIKQGENLSWAESSAIVYANSVLKAKTNRESGISALASAIIGKTPNYGYLLSENRIPNISININDKIQDSDYGILGFLTGSLIKGKIPYFFLSSAPLDDELKHLGAGLASSGSVALFYYGYNRSSSREQNNILNGDIKSRRADQRYLDDLKFDEEIEITKKDIDEVYTEKKHKDADLVVIGCPHCSVSELKRINSLLKNKKVKKDFMICTSRYIKDSHKDLIKDIEASGARVICDTCPVVSPLRGYSCAMVNSGKAYNYMPTMNNIPTKIGTTEECINESLVV